MCMHQPNIGEKNQIKTSGLTTKPTSRPDQMSPNPRMIESYGITSLFPREWQHFQGTRTNLGKIMHLPNSTRISISE